MTNTVRKVPLIEYTFIIAAQAAVFGAIGLIVSLFFDGTSTKIVLLFSVVFFAVMTVYLWRQMLSLPDGPDEDQ